MQLTTRFTSALLALLTLAGLSCQQQSSGDAEPATEPDAELSITVSSHQKNSLLAEVVVTASSESIVELAVHSNETPERTALSSATSGHHSFTVAGLRAETNYQFTASVDDQTVRTQFTTGLLPAGAPKTNVISARTQSADADLSDGVTFFGVTNQTDQPTFYGVDSEGYVVWYLESDDEPGVDPFIRNLGNGEILVTFRSTVQRMKLDGQVVETYDLSEVEGWHHDVVEMPDGTLLALARETRVVQGNEIKGDTIVQIDASGETIWEWSTFDHLDTSRFPGELAQSEARSGGLDWTHANSLYYDEQTKAILVSSRSQHWIVSIDRMSGAINWIAGEDRFVSPGFDATFIELESGSWTTGQHAATLSQDGELVVYDNRNESNGNEQGSRAVIYDIDQTEASATQVFEYVVPKYTSSLGDVDELPNTNLLITAGGPGSSNDAHVVEVDRNGATVWELTLPTRIYRSERVVWDDMVVTAEASGPQHPPSTGDTVDITGNVLTATNPSCSDYVGSYRADATDVQQNTEFESSLEITANAETCTLASNQIPNHTIGEHAQFANETSEVEATFTIPVTPALQDTVTPLGFTVHGIFLNGVTWEAYPAACFDEGPRGRLGNEAIGCGGSQLDHPWRYNVGSELHAFSLDRFSAHPQADGLYHYHATPQVLYEPQCEGLEESPVIGFARDGFPIFGPCFTDAEGTIRAAQSSYELKIGERADVEGYTTPYVVGEVASTSYDGQFISDFEYQAESGDLDECNGMTVDGQYGYYVTGEYPYVLACFSGTPSTSFG